MKVTLKFNLPEEREEYNLAMQAGNLQSALCEFSEYLRRLTKEGVKPKINASELLQEMAEYFWEIMNDHNIEL